MDVVLACSGRERYPMEPEPAGVFALAASWPEPVFEQQMAADLFTLEALLEQVTSLPPPEEVFQGADGSPVAQA